MCIHVCIWEKERKGGREREREREREGEGVCTCACCPLSVPRLRKLFVNSSPARCLFLWACSWYVCNYQSSSSTLHTLSHPLIITGASPLVCSGRVRMISKWSHQVLITNHTAMTNGSTACIVAGMTHAACCIMRTLYLYLPRRSWARVLHEALSWPSLTILLTAVRRGVISTTDIYIL